MEHKGEVEEQDLDAADYLFKTTKYHDRKITVGDPDSNQVEIFGVSTSHLVSHSRVFREMFVESQLADRTGENTHITDVTPEVFKLMLRHVYGGRLPDMSREIAGQLALCADKYNIQPLVTSALGILVPTTIKEVFPALRCVVYINAPDLEKHVVKIIQEQTDKVFAHEEFLNLHRNCIEFIAKQEQLAVSELQLWRGLVKWVKNQTDDPDEMRKLLDKPLQHVRLLTLTHDEIIKEVMPSSIFTSAEIMDMLSAISNQQTLKSPRLCSTKQNRPQTIMDKKNTYTFDSSGGCRKSLCELEEYQTISSFKIKPQTKDIEILSLTCKTRSLSMVKNSAPYSLKCNITVYTYLDGFVKNTDVIEIEGSILFEEDLVLQMKLRNGNHLKLKLPFSYIFVLVFSCAHPVFTTHSSFGSYKPDTTKEVKSSGDGVMTVKFLTPFHVKNIDYAY